MILGNLPHVSAIDATLLPVPLTSLNLKTPLFGELLLNDLNFMLSVSRHRQLRSISKTQAAVLSDGQG
jgi:hypothetical protein